MSWVLDGQVHIISIADREKTETQYGEIPISTRNVYPSCFYEQVAPAARQLLQDFITHTGQQDRKRNSGVRNCRALLWLRT